MRWTGFAGAVLAIVLAMQPMSAVASTVEIQSGPLGLEISYQAFGESNVLSIFRDADYFYFREVEGTEIFPDSPCEHPDATNPYLARCPVGVSVDPLVRVIVSLRDGNDRLTVTDSATPLIASGGAGDDNLAGGAGNEELQGGAGTDNLAGGAGNDELQGGDGDDDSLAGGAGNDELQGAAGTDNLAGGAGNDDLQGGVGDDRLRGGEGSDRLDFSDVMSDELGADLLEGGPGDDDINGGTAGTPLESDVLSGGEGTDTAHFSERTEPLTIDLDGDPDDGESGERDNVRPDVEVLIGGSESDQLTGNAAANTLDGGGAADTLEGRAGDDELLGGKDEAGDTLRGENGRDTLTGGQGEDDLTGGEDDDTLMGGGGADALDADRGSDTLEGGPGGDALDGGPGNDFLYGGALVGLVGADGDDRLNGGQGVDRLFGGRGNDELDGGPDADRMSGGAGKDVMTYDDRANRVWVSLNGMADDGEIGEDDNVAADVEVIIGSEVDDTLSGDPDASSLDGGLGEDWIDAGGGRDRLTGGKDSDLLEARDGNFDVVDCRDDKDLAIADRDDVVRNCETVDRPGHRHPIVGRYARVLRESEFRLRLPQGRRFFRLNQDVKIPIESAIDPRADDVRLVTARNSAGARQVASVAAGRFAVRQRGRRDAVTELRLAGRLPDCRGSSTRRGRAKRAARSSPRRLRVAVGKSVAAPKISNRAGVSVARKKGKRRGGVEVRGKYSRGASVGTEWLTEDTCKGTRTTVKSGTVRVEDFGRGRTVTVRPGKPYLARAE